MKKDIRYVPTPDSVVQAMLDLCGLKPTDHLYDLGCGDGRIPIQAALRGATAQGIDIDPSLLSRSEKNARLAGVELKVEFLLGDFFQADLSKASVVSLYLRQTVNLQLREKLLKELRPGSRIVSHSFDMGDWIPTGESEADTKLLFLWVVPVR